jgi:DNA-binding SARP family transcriptional activator
LLLYLVVHRRATRERVAADLWPELDAAGAGRNLRVTLTYLHRVLEPDRAERDAPFFVRQDGGVLELCADRWLTVDAWRFEELLDDAADAERDGAPSVALAAYEEALALWRGDPLSEVYDDWALAEADRLRQRFVRAAGRCGELLLARGDTDRALALAQQALAVEAWSEPAHRLVVAAHLARRDTGMARRALDQYRKMLVELGSSPDEATAELERLLETAELR